jgi:putative selenium metabolism hydrolase
VEDGHFDLSDEASDNMKGNIEDEGVKLYDMSYYELPMSKIGSDSNGNSGNVEGNAETKDDTEDSENDAADETEIKGLVKMLDKKYNPEWEEANFLGRGTVTTSEIFFTSPSRCAVADSCAVSLDRRMTAGETWESCLDEIRALPSVKKYGDDVKVSMYEYSRPSWTELVYPIECYFPTWVIPKDHKVTSALEEAYHNLYGTERMGNAETEAMRKARPLTDKWTFSTNGVSIMGRNGIPCIGFGPGAEAQAHAPNEKTWKDDLVRCAAVYAALPTAYCK